MKKTLFLLVFMVIFAILIIGAQAKDNNGGRKIVVYQAELSESAKDEIDAQIGGVRLKNLDLIGARVVYLSDRAAVEKLKADRRVLRVEDDVEVFALGRLESEKVFQQAQTIPWGIDRIDAELAWEFASSGDPVKVGIIDTGISKDHPDLKANIKGGVNTINSRKSWNDDNGHGSHVAGIAAALNNGVGVVGAAPLADLYAIKVLGASGSGYISDVIEGIQWAIANKMQVVNMSLGASVNIEAFHDAVIAAKNAGIVVVAAAGNSGGSVLYPAAYPEAIAVSATDQNNNLAGFSSRGPQIDLAAPGVSIYSTYKGSGYATLSGTSMAAPHVAGVSALLLNTPVGAYDADYDGGWDPDETQAKLQATAVDLGAAGFDNLFGFGLVNAFNAVQ